MNPFYTMLKKIISSPYHDRMVRFIQPLKDHFGVNHFWYYRITCSGHYSYMGTHAAWNEYCFDQSMIHYFPCLRHPHSFQNGVSLMKSSADGEYRKVLLTAWEKFQINFNINTVKRTAEGMEAFGFGTCFNDPTADERLLNELPLLLHFTKIFREQNEKLFQLLDDNQVDLSSYLGPLFYEKPQDSASTVKRNLFLKKIGFTIRAPLAKGETKVVRLLLKGFSAAQIAEQLDLSKRTVEHYIDNIKDKLCCFTKADLVQKASELESIGYFVP